MGGKKGGVGGGGEAVQFNNAALRETVSDITEMTLSLPPHSCLLELGGYSAAACSRGKKTWSCGFGRTFQIK